MAVKTVTQVSDSDLDSVLADPSPLMVEFYTNWCPHCRRMAPIIEELAQEYAGRMRVVQVNAESNPLSPSRLGVQGVPTMVFFVNGKQVDRLVGEASKEALGERFSALVAQPQAG